MDSFTPVDCTVESPCLTCRIRVKMENEKNPEDKRRLLHVLSHLLNFNAIPEEKCV